MIIEKLQQGGSGGEACYLVVESSELSRKTLASHPPGGLDTAFGGQGQ